MLIWPRTHSLSLNIVHFANRSSCQDRAVAQFFSVANCKTSSLEEGRRAKSVKSTSKGEVELLPVGPREPSGHIKGMNFLDCALKIVSLGFQMAVKWRDYNLTDCFSNSGCNCSVNFPQSVSVSNNQVGQRVKIFFFFFRCSGVERREVGAAIHRWCPIILCRSSRVNLADVHSGKLEDSKSSDEVWGTDDAPESLMLLYFTINKKREKATDTKKQWQPIFAQFEQFLSASPSKVFHKT